MNYRRPYFVLSLADQPPRVLTTGLIMSKLSQAITTTNFQVNWSMVTLNVFFNMELVLSSAAECR